MNRFSAEKASTAQTGENGLFRRVVGAEFGTPAYQDPFTGTGRYVPGSAPQAAAPTNTGLFDLTFEFISRMLFVHQTRNDRATIWCLWSSSTPSDWTASPLK